jgi:hypothetical protein
MRAASDEKAIEAAFLVIFFTDQDKEHRRLKQDAGIAQLVERDLAKVEVTSSSLVTRSKFKLVH